MDVTIRRGTVADAAALAELAARLFYDTFAADNRPDDMARYLADAYGVAQQRRELDDPDMTTFLAETDHQFAGYAQLRSGETPDCVHGASPLELWRLYVDGPWQGRGVAHRLMDLVETEAHARGGRTLWLGVWERNYRAQAFYRKRGFTDVGSHVFMVGDDAQTDRIFMRVLD